MGAEAHTFGKGAALSGSRGGSEKEEMQRETRNAAAVREGIKGNYLPKFITCLVILLLTFGLSHGIEFRQKVPISKPMSQFPMKLGGWEGRSEAIEQRYLDILQFTDHVLANYTNRQGKTVNFYVAYYQDQRKGESLHSPETCFPAGGWEIKKATT